jgi:type II secretory pathway component PulC
LAGVCSTITLKTGDIVVTQNNLTIKAPRRR